MPTEPRPATLRVDLDALARNYRTLRERAKPGECAAVVKADAYGLGVERVARRLLREGCRRFFVATLAEAQTLRAVAPDAEIAVFEGALASTADALAKIEARPVLSTLEQIERWRGGAARCCTSTAASTGSASRRPTRPRSLTVASCSRI